MAEALRLVNQTTISSIQSSIRKHYEALTSENSLVVKQLDLKVLANALYELSKIGTPKILFLDSRYYWDLITSRDFQGFLDLETRQGLSRVGRAGVMFGLSVLTDAHLPVEERYMSGIILALE
jgi:hypothetical protein